jgi:anthranilate synthase/indole-3-glycerol phosphate synthase/phosphoribosylanthranilate isomerase
MANFLKYKGGHWGGENAWCGVEAPASASAAPNGGDGAVPPATVQANGVDDPSAVKAASAPKKSSANGLPTILESIHAQRIADVAQSAAVLATTPANLATSLSLHTAPTQIDLVARINATPHTAVMAEIKRASPSKGDIAPLASAPAQALRYALAGASVISVLTEPKWFKGGLTDMLAVRQAVDSLPNRPAILRKDFILAPYQIDEARLHGADTVLLIVAMLTPQELKQLYTYSLSLGMEPLVEVNNVEELQLALELGAKVIGVNNRNLHDFNVDMSTTSRVNAALEGREVILCALSGISSPADVETYVKEGVRAVLVGESLMRASDAGAFLRQLIGLPAPAAIEKRKPLVKICGIRSAADASLAIESGADMLGIILVPGSKRSISTGTAREIASLVRTAREKNAAPARVPKPDDPESWFAFHERQLANRKKPLLVGVFRDQPLEDVLAATEEIGLDMVQLHGDEPQDWAKFIPVPVIKCFRIKTSSDENAPRGVKVQVQGGQVDRPGCNQYILLDAAGAGGTGEAFDWTAAVDIVNRGEVGSEGKNKLPVMLAGGLSPDNVQDAVKRVHVMGVDVSTGVESGDGKDEGKVKAFVQDARA